MNPGTRCPVGDIRITPSFNLRAKGVKFIIHANGPFGDDPNRVKLLQKCYYDSMVAANDVAALKKIVPGDDGLIRSIALPALSVGVFEYPHEEATRIAVKTVLNFIVSAQNLNIKEVRFVVFSKSSDLYGLYLKEVKYFLEKP